MNTASVSATVLPENAQASQAARKALQELQKTAIIGLGHSPDLQQIERHLAAIPGGAQILQQSAADSRDKGQQFMENLLLAQGACQFSRLPVADRYDELPDVPAEITAPLTAQQLQQFDDIGRGCEADDYLDVITRLLAGHQRAIPDTKLMPLVQRYQSQPAPLRQVLTLLSQRGEWLLRLDHQLITDTNALPNPQLPHPQALVRWLQQASETDWQTLWQHWPNLNRQWQERYILTLNEANHELLLQFVKGCWSVVAVDGRERLIPLVARLCELARPPAPSATGILNSLKKRVLGESEVVPHRLTAADTSIVAELWQWMQETRRDRSAKIRQLMLPLMYQLAQELPDNLQDDNSRALVSALEQQLQCYLPRQGAHDTEPLAPEELTPELEALGIQNSRQYAKSIAAGRLVQLVELAGVDLIARYLQCTAAMMVTTLAKSAFGEELSPALLASCLRNRDPAALQSWCKHYTQDNYQQSNIVGTYVSHYGTAEMASRLVILCDSGLTNMACSRQMASTLSNLGLELSADHSAVFIQQLLKERHLYGLPLWGNVLNLNSNSQKLIDQYQQNAINKSNTVPPQLSAFTTLFALRASLHS